MQLRQSPGYGWPVDVDPLINETAAIVAPGYALPGVSNTAGLLLDSRYEGEASQLMPPALELSRPRTRGARR
jgi:hypothetical protein